MNNRITGNAGVNVITGGGGRDVMTGNAGADVFVFRSIGESISSSRDVITDFVRGTDKINLSPIDANAANGSTTNEVFAFIGTASFVANSPGRIRILEQGGVATIVQGNVNNDTVADFEIQLNGVGLGLTAADFIL